MSAHISLASGDVTVVDFDNESDTVTFTVIPEDPKNPVNKDPIPLFDANQRACYDSNIIQIIPDNRSDSLESVDLSNSENRTTPLSPSLPKISNATNCIPGSPSEESETRSSADESYTHNNLIIQSSSTKDYNTRQNPFIKIWNYFKEYLTSRTKYGNLSASSGNLRGDCIESDKSGSPALPNLDESTALCLPLDESEENERDIIDISNPATSGLDYSGLSNTSFESAKTRNGTDFVFALVNRLINHSEHGAIECPGENDTGESVSDSILGESPTDADLTIASSSSDSDEEVNASDLEMKEDESLPNPNSTNESVAGEIPDNQEFQDNDTSSACELLEFETSSFTYCDYMKTRVGRLWGSVIGMCNNVSSGHFNWTVLHAWHFLAYVSCVVPSRLVYNREERKHVLKYWLPQQVMFSCRCAFLLILTLATIPKIQAALKEPISPLSILSTADQLLATCMRICFLHFVLCGKSSLLNVQDFYSFLQRTYEHSSLSPVSKKMGLGGLFGFSLYAAFTLAVEIVSKVYEFHEDWSGEPSIFLEAFAHFCKQTMLWNGTESSNIAATLRDMDKTDIVVGLLGVGIYVCEKTMDLHVVLALLASCLTFMFSTLFIMEKTLPLTEKYRLVNEAKEKTSLLIGSVLFCFMAILSLGAPTLIIEMYQRESSLLIALQTFKLLVAVAPLIVASIAALWIDQLKQRFFYMENVAELPGEPSLRDTFIYNLSQNSSGIGYNGIFVLNFATLLGYGLGIGGVILVIAEALSSLQTA